MQVLLEHRIGRRRVVERLYIVFINEDVRDGVRQMNWQNSPDDSLDFTGTSESGSN